MALPIGPNRGFKTTKRVPRQLHPKKKSFAKKIERRTIAREVIREVAGFAPYEKRIMELLRMGKEKRALKFAKARLGTHRAGKMKRAKMVEVLNQIRKAQAAAAAAPAAKA